MSVAFRRESDDEHKEPKFEIPIPVGPNLVTARGLALTEARVTELEAALAEEAEETRRSEINRDLRYWRTRLATAELQPLANGDEVAFGTRVVFRLNGKERRVDLVGDDESDPGEGRISFSSPLSRALMGACAGDFVDWNGTPDAIEIISVGAIPEDK